MNDTTSSFPKMSSFWRGTNVSVYIFYGKPTAMCETSLKFNMF